MWRTRSYFDDRLRNRLFSITEKDKIRLDISRTRRTATTDGKVVYLPKYKLNRDGVINSYIDMLHEGGHIKYSSFEWDRVTKFAKDSKLKWKYIDKNGVDWGFKRLLNIIEDYRVNTFLTFDYPGISSLRHRYVETKLKKDFPDGIPVDIPYMMYVMLHGYDLKLLTDKDTLAKLEQAREVAKDAIKYSAMLDLLIIVKKVYEILDVPKIKHEEDEPEPKKTGEGEDAYKDDPKEREKAEEESKKTAEDIKEKGVDDEGDDGIKVIEEKVDGDEEEDDEGGMRKDDGKTPGGSGDKEPDEITEDEIEELVQEVRNLSEKEQKEEMKVVKEAREQAKKAETKKPVRNRKETFYNKQEYKRILRNRKMQIQHLTKELNKIWKYKRTYQRGHRNGRIVPKDLYRLRTQTGEPRVFKKKLSHKNAGGVAILLLVDMSGSMIDYGKSEIAKETAIIFHEVLNDLDINHAILGYTGDEEKTDNIILKDWSETDRCLPLTAIRGIAHNRDGDSIRIAKEYFNGITDKNKIMIVISDGEPYVPNYCGAQAISDTIKAQHEVKKSGIKMINIGVQYNMPKGYINQIIIKDVKKLPKEMMKLLRREL